MAKVILHIDLNAFFVRCEELKDPSIIGKPVIIGHVGRCGIVSTCSYKAREYGIHSGMPTHEALRLHKDCLVLHDDFKYYSEKSNQFFNYIKRFSNIIEKASIDECFIDMTETLENEPNPLEFVKKMQQGLYKETGLYCSIGVAPTKFLAKMASDMKKPMGITIIHRRNVRKMLDPLPIDDFFGIGKKTAPRLKELGIKTIGDLAKRVNEEDPIIKNALGGFYPTVKEWINGYGSDVVDTSPWDPKSMGHTTTLPHDSADPEELLQYIKNIAKETCDDVKHANKVGKIVQLVLKDNQFKVINRSKRLQTFTNDEDVVYKTAERLFKENYDGREIRLVGVTLQSLKDPNEIVEQLSIFDNFDEIKQENEIRILIGDLNRQMKKSVFKTAGDHLRENRHGTK